MMNRAMLNRAMMNRALTTVVMIAVVVACVVAVVSISPAALPRVTKVVPATGNKTNCLPAVAAGGTVYLSGAEQAGGLGASSARVKDPVILSNQKAPVAATGNKPLIGGFLTPAGSSAAWTPCAAVLTKGSLLVDSAADTELLIVNSDPSDASVDLSIYGPAGEVVALGARGIAVAPNSSRIIALSVLFKGQGPVAVNYTTSRGRATVIARTNSTAGASASVATQPGTNLLLPGVPAKAGTATVLLANPGNQRATVDITAFGTTVGYQPAGGTGIEVPAYSTRKVALAGSLAGEATNLQVTANKPIVAALSTGNKALANVAPATADTELAGFAPTGGVLQLSTSGTSPVQVTLNHLDAAGKPVSQKISVPAKGIFSLPLPAKAAGAQFIKLTASAEVFGAVVLVNPTQSIVVPLQPATSQAKPPLAAELDPQLN